jgi:hypothetical protein
MWLGWHPVAAIQLTFTYKQYVTYTQVEWYVFDFLMIRSLMITNILTATFNQHFNNRRGQ